MVVKVRWVQSMRKIADYKKHADECRFMAASAREDQKVTLLEMAKTWDMLAEDRERVLEQKSRIDALGIVGT